MSENSFLNILLCKNFILLCIKSILLIILQSTKSAYFIRSFRLLKRSFSTKLYMKREIYFKINFSFLRSVTIGEYDHGYNWYSISSNCWCYSWWLSSKTLWHSLILSKLSNYKNYCRLNNGSSRMRSL